MADKTRDDVYDLCDFFLNIDVAKWLGFILAASWSASHVSQMNYARISMLQKLINLAQTTLEAPAASGLFEIILDKLSQISNLTKFVLKVTRKYQLRLNGLLSDGK